MFFAISGAMMLGREISLKKIWTQRIPKTLLMLAVFSVASHLISAADGRELLSLKRMIFRAYDQDLNYAYWYLYAYIAFLMSLPMLSAMLRGLKDREVLYMVCLAVFFRSFLPAFEQMRWKGTHHLNNHMNVTWLMADIVIYPSIGYYLHHRMDVHACKRALPILWIAAAAGLYMSCLLTWREYLNTWIMHIETYHSLFGGVYAAAIFATMRVLYEHVRADGWLGKATAALGGMTLGVYLLHVPVMDHTDLFQKLVWIPMDALHLPQLICGGIYIVLLFAACAAITVVLKKIPGIRELLK